MMLKKWKITETTLNDIDSLNKRLNNTEMFANLHTLEIKLCFTTFPFGVFLGRFFGSKILLKSC